MWSVWQHHQRDLSGKSELNAALESEEVPQLWNRRLPLKQATFHSASGQCKTYSGMTQGSAPSPLLLILSSSDLRSSSGLCHLQDYLLFPLLWETSVKARRRGWWESGGELCWVVHREQSAAQDRNLNRGFLLVQLRFSKTLRVHITRMRNRV